MRSVSVQDGADFGIKVAHPDQPVALDAVVNILLAVQVDGVGGDVPDAVQPRVVGFERAAVLPVAVDRGDGDAGQLRFGRVGGNFETDEPEGALTEKHLSECRKRQCFAMDRVVLRRFAERLRNRFAEGDAYP
ncbi:hypothetical protein SDC9_147966 [bioreactor metagenome]|uniref:Uncharacterized protein n=1 Tax=bioreactor metagenome TaxID=1076179 RepID=A0A645EFI3_9ZZZZ